MKQLLTFLLIISSTFLANAQLNMTYVSDLSYNANLNDVWGYVAPDGTEYALVGVANGTSIVSLADPENPLEVAFVPGSNTVWRDIKTWENFAYVTCDNCGDGLAVIDLSNLPISVNSYQLTSIPLGTIGSCHNIYIDEFGYAYLAGCNGLNNGGMVFLDCATDPSTPAYAGIGAPVYSHDVYTRDNKMYSSEIGAGVFTIYDVTDKNSVVALGSQATPFSQTHNAWLSDDGNILFTTDELANAPVASYDVSDPTDIKFLDQYAPLETLGDGVIPHNVHVWTNWLIVSYYTDGCIIIDATYPDNLIEVGNFDTYIPTSTGFNGVWGAYPFLPSGLVLCTDIGNGLYILEPNYVQACYLEGDVTNSVTGADIPGANVSLLSTLVFTETDALGEFKTGIAIPGTYEIEVFKPGFETATISATITNGEITFINVELTPLTSFAMSGMVLEASSNNPISNASVSIENQYFLYETNTDAAGNFTIPAMFEGTYDVFAGSWGYKTNAAEAQDLSLNNNSITIELEVGLEDVFSVDLGWIATSDSMDIQGSWERGIPIGAVGGGAFITPSEDISEDLGNHCYVTGNTADLFAGVLLEAGATLTSPVFDLTGYNTPMLNYHYWFLSVNVNNGNNGFDELVVKLNNGIDEVIIAEYDTEAFDQLEWENSTEIKIDSLIEPTNNMTFSIEAFSSGLPFATEAALDYWRIWDADPTPSSVNNITDYSIRIGISPNPSTLDFHMNYDLEEWNGKADVLVNNVLGQTVEQISLSSSTGTLRFGSTLPTGIYFVHIKEDNRSSRVIKLIKE